MSRTKKSRKQGKLTVVLPGGPSKTELLADPDSREARRKRAQERKRRQQRSIKRGPEAQSAQEGANAAQKSQASRKPRLKASPEAVAAASQALLEQPNNPDHTDA